MIQVLWKGLDHQLHCPFPTIKFSPRIFLSHCHFLKINFYWSIAALGFTDGLVVKNLPAKQETWFQSSGQEDPLDKEMATTPVFLPGKSHGQRSLAGYGPWGHKELNMTETEP